MGIKNDIDELKELIKSQENKKTEKKFKIPLSKRVGGGKAKKNYVTVMKIHENGNVDFKRLQIDEQTIKEDGIPRLASPDYVLRYKKNPLIILPSWSVKPYSPASQYQKSLNDGSNTTGYKILLAKMLKDQVGKKTEISGLVKWIIGLGLLGIIGYAMITGGG